MSNRPSKRVWRPRIFGWLIAVALFGFASVSNAQAPETDIVVLELDRAGRSFSGLHRVTDRPAYDNQPKFLPDGRLVYTAAGESTTEIHSYDVGAERHKVLFVLPENLYSPTPVPGEEAVSVIRDYGNQVQQLWKLPLDGSPPRPLQTSINPIGYHAWYTHDQLILFVLGEPQTLQLMTLGSDQGKFLHDSPGRALAMIPSASAGSDVKMSFTRPKPGADGAFELVALTLNPSASFRPVATLPGDSQDYAWAPDGSLWIGRGTELLRWNTEDWTSVIDVSAADFTDVSLGSISRLAWSEDGRYLAAVVER